MPDSHALLSPSSAARWMICTPSARMEAEIPDRDTKFSREGTIAHALGEFLLNYYKSRGALSVPDADEITKSDHVLTEGLDRHLSEARAEGYDSVDMLYSINDRYVKPVMEMFAGLKSDDQYSELYVEQRLSLSKYVPESFGTSDAVIVSGRTINVIDLKYGKGVKVSAERNAQMMCYAVGAVEALAEFYDVDTVRMTIIQPRLDHISQWEMPLDKLMTWADTELHDAAELAFSGEGETVPGDHCRFCKAAPVCRSLRDDCLAHADNVSPVGNILDAAGVAYALDRLPVLKAWISSLEAYALELAVSGDRVPGYKLVEGRSVRKYSDEDKCAEILRSAGFSDEDFYKKRELKGITDMEKLLRKKAFNDLLGPYVIKPAGKPTLVPDDDPRPALTDAETDFKEMLN